MREDYVCRCFHIQVSPAVLIVRTRATHIIRRVNQKCLQHAGTHSLARKFPAVQLNQQSSRARCVRSCHTSTAVSCIISCIARGNAGVHIHPVRHQVWLDPSVVARTHTGKVSQSTFGDVADAGSDCIVRCSYSQNVFGKATEGNRLISSQCG